MSSLLQIFCDIISFKRYTHIPDADNKFVIRYLSYGPYIITLEIPEGAIINENLFCSKFKRFFKINKDNLKYYCNQGRVVNIVNKFNKSIRNKFKVQINGEQVELKIGEHLQLKNQKIYYFLTERGAYYHNLHEYIIKRQSSVFFKI